MFLGIEIGGTKLQLSLGPGDGQLRSVWRGDVNPALGGDGIRQQISAAIPILLEQAGVNVMSLRGIGVGFGGPTDDATQTVIKSHHIAGWNGFPLGNWLSEQFQLPCVICNDADVAGLAEAIHGAGRGYSPIFYITVGSGIGGGLVIDQEIYRGVGQGAAEIGHLRADEQGNILEHYASGWSLGARAREQLLQGHGADSSLRQILNLDQITGKDVGAAALRGDRFALSILQRATQALGRAIGEVIRLLCPKRVIIGGGVSLLGEAIFFQPLRDVVNREAFQAFAGLTEIVPAELGEEVVLHGALALARQKFGAE